MSTPPFSSPDNGDLRSAKDDALYRDNVNRLMDAGSDELISNGLPQHAAALFECFFRHTASEIKIVCKNLQREVFDSPDVLSSFLSAARRGVSIQILVQQTPEPNSVFRKAFEELQEKGHGNLFLQTEAAAKSELVASRPENFAVMDRRAFRYEANHYECKAVASMNQPVLAGQLCQVFDRLYASLCQKSGVMAAV